MDEFESFLAENMDKNFYVITPGGNPGDILIHMGLMKKLKKIKAKHRCVNLEEVYKKRIRVGIKYLLNIAAFKAGLDCQFKLFHIPKESEVILFEGGGYMNDLYYGLVLLKGILKEYKKPVVVAPHSFWFRSTDFRKFFIDKRPVVLFCREKYSFNILSEMHLPRNVEVRLSKDTSLYLTREELSEFTHFSAREDTLVCLRNDRESMIPKKAKRKIVEKVKEKAGRMLVADISKWRPLNAYISAIANSSKVYTDRLHIAILAHIFGKDLTFFSNCYHKNKGVFEYSMIGNPKVSFKDPSDFCEV
jgi:exopolysaccharide biosynthesis predicted pyruvyltransferase EpsI